MNKAPAFDSSDVTVIFVLGGPGSGKGTQCAKLVQRYNFTHLSGISQFSLHVAQYYPSLTDL